MTLSFFTHNHQMTFVDSLGNAASASALWPDADYTVYFVVQNDAAAIAHHVQIYVQHSAFGIGVPGGASGIVQPAAVDVPPAGPGGPGLATVSFQFHTPPGGHGCLSAQIMPNGAILSQNTDIASLPTGATSAYSFLVSNPNPAPEVMILTLVERLESGGAVPAAQSWQPQFVAPAVTTPAGSNPTAYKLNLAAGGFYVINLQVTIPSSATQAHVFHVTGLVSGHDVGEVDITVRPVLGSSWIAPDPYVHGGYQSPDVILFDPVTHLPVPLGGAPGMPWDTVLRPNTDYDLAARVYNASPTPADNTVVRFWEFPGGNSALGILLSTTMLDVPPCSSAVVHSTKPFRSGPRGQHNCAVISIYNSLAGTCPDALTSSQVPDPSANAGHSCSAWRNTESRIIVVGTPWTLSLAQQMEGEVAPQPIDLEVQPYHVNREWLANEAVRQAQKILAESGAAAATPVYLMKSLRPTLPVAKTHFKLETRGQLVELNPQPEPPLPARWRITPTAEGPTPFILAGELPAAAKPGDVVLILVTARYPETKLTPSRAVEFLEILHVVDKKYKK